MRGFKFFIVTGLIILLISSVFATPKDDLNIRLTKLETLVQLKFDEHEKALVLAREALAREREATALTIAGKMEHLNEYRLQLTAQEATYAKKDELSALEKLVYIGIGIVLAIQFITVLYFGRRKNGKS